MFHVEQKLRKNMSYAIPYCLISKAGYEDEDAFHELSKLMKSNIAYGHFSYFPCNHNPKCPPLNEEQLRCLNLRLSEVLKDIKPRSHTSAPGPEGPQGSGQTG